MARGAEHYRRAVIKKSPARCETCSIRSRKPFVPCVLCGSFRSVQSLIRSCRSSRTAPSFQ